MNKILDTEHAKIVNYLKNNNCINLQKLESGLILLEGCKKGKFKQLPSNDCDIFCFNQNDNDIVVVEVKSKSETANHKTFGQILNYFVQAENITCANAELGESNVNKVRGIILAKEIDKSLKKLVNKYKKVTPRIDLKEYDWIGDNLEITDIILSNDI